MAAGSSLPHETTESPSPSDRGGEDQRRGHLGRGPILSALTITTAAMAAAALLQFGILPRLGLPLQAAVVIAIALVVQALLLGVIAFLWSVRGRREAERATAESEKRARLLLRHIVDVVTTLDAEARFTFISPSVKPTLGYAEKDILGQNFYDFVYPDDVGKTFEHMSQMMADPGRAHHFDLRLRRADGSWASFEALGRSLLAEAAVGSLVVNLRDVTARRQRERTLRETEERFRLLVQGVRTYAIMLLDPDGRVVSWNEGAARITGYEESEILGQAFERFYTPEDRGEGRPQKHLDSALAEGRLLAQGRRVRKDGSSYWSEVSMTPLYDNEGQHRGYAKITRDITERKAAEERLRRSESLLSQAQELAHIGSWEWDLVTEEVTWSDELYRIYGVAPGAYRPSYEGYLERIHPEERASTEEAIRHTVATGEPFAADRRVVRPDGSIRWMHATGHMALDGQGRPVRMFGTCQDITEQKHMENALQIQTELYLSMLNAESELGEGVLLAEGDTIVYHNSALARLFGFEVSPPRSVRTLLAQSDPVGSEPFLNDLEERAERPLPPARGETTLRRRDGSLAHIGYIVSSVAGPDRPRVFAVFRDETERRSALEALQESREQLRRFSSEIERAREEVSARIAREIHDELGQQLTGLKLDLAWLGGHIRSSDAEPDRLLEKVQDMASLVDTTVEQVRRIASELRPGVLDDLGLAAALEWQAGEFEIRTGIRCRLECDPEVETLPPEHATAMFRIFQEALTNVARHAGATFVDISLSLNDRSLRLVIADDGRGIHAQELRSRSSLGLLGMRERAHVLGGETVIRPGDESGTVVDVTLPLPENGRPEA